MLSVETGSTSSVYEDELERYTDEMEEDDENNKELEYYKTILTEESELGKGIVTTPGGEISF